MLDFLRSPAACQLNLKMQTMYKLLEYDIITKYSYYCKCTMEPCGNG